MIKRKLIYGTVFAAMLALGACSSDNDPATPTEPNGGNGGENPPPTSQPQALDLNANMLVEFENGAHGVYASSQVCVGHANGLVVRIFGTKGAIEWHQEEADHLYVTRKGFGTQMYNRGMGYITGRAAELNRIPSGHPEGLYVAFGNVYKTYINAILKKINGEILTESDLDFPSVSDGVDGVKFIHSVINSNNNNSTWTEI
jgi:predicted dehydrogenase